MDIERFKRAVENMDKMRKGEIDSLKEGGRFKAFVEEFNLLDPTTFGAVVDESTSSA
jgi:hypothetical protein